jgi:hypothetical protein
MSCPDFEVLLREGRGGHAAECERCGALLDAVADVDAGLEAAWSGVSAPPSLAASVRLRIAAEEARRRPSLVPEVLDFIGWAAILALVAVVAQRYLPLLTSGGL